VGAGGCVAVGAGGWVATGAVVAAGPQAVSSMTAVTKIETNKYIFFIVFFSSHEIKDLAGMMNPNDNFILSRFPE
jgi:hypothetical protein